MAAFVVNVKQHCAAFCLCAACKHLWNSSFFKKMCACIQTNKLQFPPWYFFFTFSSSKGSAVSTDLLHPLEKTNHSQWFLLRLTGDVIEPWCKMDNLTSQMRLQLRSVAVGTGPHCFIYSTSRRAVSANPRRLACVWLNRSEVRLLSSWTAEWPGCLS